MRSVVLEWERKLAPARQFLEQAVAPVSDLLLRWVMAWVFFSSGWIKLDYLLSGKWDTVLYLFEEEHPVPFLPVEVAAMMGTAAETVLPALLAVGLFGRLAALGLMGVTLVIVSTGIAPLTLQGQLEHLLWIAALGALLVRGPGKISLDYLVFRKTG